LQLSLNMACLLVVISMVFCWFYGLPPLAAGFFGLRKIIRLRKGKKPGKPAVAFKLKWGFIIGWAGVIFSGIFTVIYALALITGAFVRW
jgi:hypothetical protein